MQAYGTFADDSPERGTAGRRKVVALVALSAVAAVAVAVVGIQTELYSVSRVQVLLECVIECNASPTWEGSHRQVGHASPQETQLSQRHQRVQRGRAPPARAPPHSAQGSEAARAAVNAVKHTMAQIKKLNMMTQGKPFGAAKRRIAELKATLKHQMVVMDRAAAAGKKAASGSHGWHRPSARTHHVAPLPALKQTPRQQSSPSGYAALMDRMKKFKSGEVKSGRQMIHHKAAPSLTTTYSGAVQADAPQAHSSPANAKPTSFLAQIDKHSAPKPPPHAALLTPQHHIYYEGVLVA